MKSDYGNDNYYYLLDFSNTNSLSKNIKIITKDHPDIDILINNAGITNDNLFLRMKENQWEEVIKINLNSNFYILKEILPNMLKRKSGNIIGITSVIAFTGKQGQANYAASKAALISMYKSISLEDSSRNIRVNSIAPGFIKTSILDSRLNSFGIKEDFIEMLLLSKNSHIIGTYLSTYTEVAWWFGGATAKVVVC